MALYIIRKSHHLELNWHIGEKKPMTFGEPYMDIAEVQADGHELNYIRKRFINLPDIKGGVVSWKGDWAQFIYDHLV